MHTRGTPETTPRDKCCSRNTPTPQRACLPPHAEQVHDYCEYIEIFVARRWMRACVRPGATS